MLIYFDTAKHLFRSVSSEHLRPPRVIHVTYKMTSLWNKLRYKLSILTFSRDDPRSNQIRFIRHQNDSFRADSVQRP